VRVGITGWRGFIGSHLKDKLEQPILFQGDMTVLEGVRKFVKECDMIYHIAGKNKAEKGLVIKNNILSTGNLLLACTLEGVSPQVVFTSSKQVEWNRDSEYGLAKYLEEKIIGNFKRYYIFRVPNVYGEGCKPFYNSVVATFCYQLVHGLKVTVNDPNVKREFIYIDDLVNQLLNLEYVWRYGEIKGEVMTIGEIYDYLTSRLGQHEKLKQCYDYYLRSKDVSIA
jgi:UDP-2-acetamido-2,6-beta-L-arabino-hexul-4-ose reductase